MSVICSQATVSGEKGIRKDQDHPAKGKQTTVREHVKAGLLEYQTPSINCSFNHYIVVMR
jgi:hypothetical protein